MHVRATVSYAPNFNGTLESVVCTQSSKNLNFMKITIFDCNEDIRDSKNLTELVNHSNRLTKA